MLYSRSVMAQKKLKAISLFSGGGGMDIGVKKSGFDVRASFEIDKYACETLRYNIEVENEKTKVYEGDIKEVEIDVVKKELNIKSGELDLLFGGPPCQSFSAIGKQKSLEDPRGLLLFQMIRFTDALRPRVVLMEQVKGLLNAPDENGVRGGVFSTLKKEFEDLGYKVFYQVINAANYGVPQRRERVFLVALQNQVFKNCSFEFPSPTHGETDNALFPLLPYKTVGDAIGDLGSPMLKNGHIPEDSHLDVTPDRDRFRMNGVPEGSWLAKELHLPIEQRCTLGKKDTTKYRRMHRNEAALTLRCGEIFYHPTENRYLTPREYMRLHGYPDSYKLKGVIRSRTGVAKNLDQHRQVANSVPPPIAFQLANLIRKTIECQNSLKYSATL